MIYKLIKRQSHTVQMNGFLIYVYYAEDSPVDSQNISGSVLNPPNDSSHLPPTIIHLHIAPLGQVVSQRCEVPSAAHPTVITWSITLSPRLNLSFLLTLCALPQRQKEI